MIDLKQEVKTKNMLDSPVESDEPEYPWGLRITLDDKTMEKLGITELPTVGAMMSISAVAQVVSVSEHSSTDDPQNRSVELQIQSMKPPTQGTDDRAKQLYTNSSMN